MERTVVLLASFVAFAAVLVVLGAYTRRWIQDASDYLLGGREVSLLVNAMGVAAIGFAGTSIALGPAFTLTHGLLGSLAFGLIYSLGGLALYGLVFAGFIRRCGAQTLPEWLELRFDARTRLLVTVTTLLGLSGIMANNVVSLAQQLASFAGWPLPLVVSAVFLTFLVFSYLGGFWAVTLTDFAQMLLGLVAMPLLLVALVARYGGPDAVAAQWPGPDPWVAGLTGATLPGLRLTYPSLLTFVLLFSAFLVWGNNYYWLRVASCRSERTARLSYVYAGILLVVFIFLPLGLAGLYAGAAHPDLFQPVGRVPPTGAFGVLVRELPTGIAALLLVAAAAASVSTATTAHLGATATAVRDVYQRVFRPEATPQQLVLPSRAIMLLIGVLIWLLSFYPGGPVYLFAFSTAWLGPPSLLVLLGAFTRRFNAAGAFWGVLAGTVSMMALTLLELTGRYKSSQLAHVGVFGLAATLLVGGAVALVTGRREARERSAEPLGERERAALDLVRRGYTTLAELVDLLGLDAAHAHAAVERLEAAGFLERKAATGAGYYEFRITPAGQEAAGPLTEGERRLVELGLDRDRLEVLRAAATPGGLHRLQASGRYTSLQLSTLVARLVRDGHLAEGGLWKRALTLTDSGRRALAAAG